MKKNFPLLLIFSLTTTLSLYCQKSGTGVKTIKSSDLESYLSFIASPHLRGRMNGEAGLDITASYIASQAKKIGLKPVDGSSYIHTYNVISKSLDMKTSEIRVTRTDGTISVINEPFYQRLPSGPGNFKAEGDVVFAGYGINAPEYKYSDFDSIKLEGKILLIMDRAPSTPDGKKCLFEDQKWMTNTGLINKLKFLIFTRVKAILVVNDPKSGYNSLDESNPGTAEYLKSTMTLKGDRDKIKDLPGMPRLIFVHRKVADEILSGTGTTLDELQNKIDEGLKPHTFEVKGKKIAINEVAPEEEKTLPNVAGIIEGRDPGLKNEVVIFSGHMDHIGMKGNEVNTGADDDASGCSALLEIAEAFQSLPKKPLRSVMFLWFSGEEIGLFGSESYVNSPYVPLDKTVADLNMDMIGRDKSEADTSKANPMTGPNAVFVITDYQSKDLVLLADQEAKKTGLTLDYSLSGRNHPLQLFARSDHYNFVQKNIPILFFTTGLHTTYHTPGDVIEKIDFRKMERITKTMYNIGYRLANQKNRILTDNPFSNWKN